MHNLFLKLHYRVKSWQLF